MLHCGLLPHNAAGNSTWCENVVADFECSAASSCIKYESYGDGSSRLGRLVRDEVHFANAGRPARVLLVDALRLSAGRLSKASNEAVDGILGLSPATGDMPSLLAELVADASIARHAFALCLPDALPDQRFALAGTGHVVLGAAHNFASDAAAAAASRAVAHTPLLLDAASPWDGPNATLSRYLIRTTSLALGRTFTQTTVDWPVQAPHLALVIFLFLSSFINLTQVSFYSFFSFFLLLSILFNFLFILSFLSFFFYQCYSIFFLFFLFFIFFYPPPPPFFYAS